MKAKNGSNGGRGYVSSMVAKKQVRKPVLKNLKGRTSMRFHRYFASIRPAMRQCSVAAEAAMKFHATFRGACLSIVVLICGVSGGKPAYATIVTAVSQQNIATMNTLTNDGTTIASVLVTATSVFHPTTDMTGTGSAAVSFSFTLMEGSTPIFIAPPYGTFDHTFTLNIDPGSSVVFYIVGKGNSHGVRFQSIGERHGNRNRQYRRLISYFIFRYFVGRLYPRDELRACRHQRAG
jgi:hypothetical protein